MARAGKAAVEKRHVEGARHAAIRETAMEIILQARTRHRLDMGGAG